MPLGQGWSIVAPLASFVWTVRRLFVETMESGLTPGGLEALEDALHRRADRMCDQLMARFLDHVIEETTLEAQARTAFRDVTPGVWASKGRREVRVQFRGGHVFEFNVSYVWDGSPDGSEQAATQWRAMAPRRGLYPGLEALGIRPRGTQTHLSGAAARRALRAGVRADSFEEAAAVQSERTGLSRDQMHGVFETVGAEMVAGREWWLDNGGREACPTGPESLADERVLICVDGGRAKTRETKPGRPLANGYHRLNCAWTEPKLLSITVLGEDGTIDRDVPAVIDGTMGEADALFDLLAGYLQALDIDEAAEVEVAGDGARWIWNRAGPMLDRLGVDEARQTEVVDFYHAAQHLWEAAQMPDGWSKGVAVSWFKKMRRALHDGDIDRVCRHLDTLSTHDGAEEATDKKDYFERNQARMSYDEFRDQDLASGSGTVESAIRRVVNLRMKNNSTYWKPDNAEKMLMLRGALKAGRFAQLWTWYRDTTTKWWAQADAERVGLRGRHRKTARSAA